MSDTQITAAVAKLYDTYPFPPEPILDQPPPGYNWRWNWLAAYNFCTRRKPSKQDIRILDAGCGSGVSTEYLVHLNPYSHVVGIDISPGTLEVARKRCQSSGANRVEFHHLSISDVDQIPGKFDLINSVGVLHHLPDPITGIQSLAGKLAPGGIMHIFVYGELGRWEIQLMQKAIALLQGSKRGDYGDGVQVGRKVFATLPENNRIVNREKARWSWENQKDECFADMYVHPQEIDYNIDSLFQLIDASGLEFVGFSNPGFWNLERLLGRAPELMARAQELSPREQYRLIELLDPEVAHYEFFLTSPPLEKSHWQDDHALLAAIPELNPCLDGFPSRCIFNYDYQIINLSPQELEFMEKCNGSQAISQILVESQVDLAGVRKLIEQQLLILSPNP